MIAATGAPANGVPMPPVAMPEPPSKGEYEPGAVLSPSQCSTFLSCSAKWFYKYVLNYPDVQGSARAVGKALHFTIRENFIQKVETKIDLPLTGALAVYKDAWIEEEKLTTFQKDEDRAELRAMGAKLVARYLEMVAPLVEPAQVELPVQGVIGGVNVRGIVDLLDVHGKVIDLKSAKTSPAKGKIRPDYRFQIATYAAITPGASGEAELHTLVKLKREIKCVPQSFKITESDQHSIEVQYPLVQEGMRSGLVFPNRNSFLCSRRYCAYVDSCIRDYGGTVGEEE